WRGRWRGSRRSELTTAAAPQQPDLSRLPAGTAAMGTMHNTCTITEVRDTPPPRRATGFHYKPDRDRLGEPARRSGMQRREFITGLVATAGWPSNVPAEQAPLRAGFLPLGSPSNSYDQSLVESFRQGLHDVGVVENRDVVLDIIWISDEAQIPRALTELMERGAGLLIPCGTSASVAAKRQVSTIPILFIDVFNPIGVGLIESFSRPGGNVTGLSDMHPDLSGKYVQLASALDRPQATVNYLWSGGSPNGQYRLRVTEEA